MSQPYLAVCKVRCGSSVSICLFQQGPWDCKGHENLFAGSPANGEEDLAMAKMQDEFDLPGRVEHRVGRPPNPVDPTSSPRARLGAELRRLREVNRLSLEALARLVRSSPSHLSDVEHGKKLPSVVLVERLERVFGTDGALTAHFPGAVLEQTVQRHEQQARRSGSPLDKLGRPVDARERLARAVARPRRVDEAAVQCVEATIGWYRRLDATIGPEDVVDTVLSELGLVERLLDGPPPDTLRPRLVSAAGELYQLAGWLSFDLQDYDGARAYYERARRAAHEAGNAALSAYVLGSNMSYMETYAGNLRDGLDLAYAAQGWAARSTNATTRAYVYTVTARAHARAGDEEACRSALDQAKVAMQDSRPDEDPPWLYVFDHSALVGHRGTCFLQLHRPQDALVAIGQEVETYSTALVRNHALALTDLATSYRELGEIEEACRHAVAALRLVSGSSSARSLQHLRDFHAGLGRWKDTNAVRHFSEQLRAVAEPGYQPLPGLGSTGSGERKYG